MPDLRIKIDALPAYDDVNNDKSRNDLFEVSKNTGTYASPVYATNGSRKISVEQLKETLNIKDYLVRDFVVINSGGTILEDKVNAIVVSADTSFTLPTADSSNYGKSLVIVNRSTYTITINGIVNGISIELTNFNETIQLSCLFDGVSTYGWWLISDATTNKICTTSVILASNTYTAKHNDNIEANALSIGSDIDITIPTAGIEGRVIYVYYPNGSPTAYEVNLIGGFTATLAQLDYFLLRDNGSYWEAISTSQNVAVTPTLDEVTGAGKTTTNSIEVGGLVVDMPSGSGVAVDITKGGAGEALTVNKTSGSGNVASFSGGTTLVEDLEVSTATANRPTFFDSSKKLVIATGALLGTWFQTLTAKSTPVDADTIVVNDSDSSFEAKKTTLTELWTNYFRAFVFSATLTTNRIVKANASGVLVDSNTVDDGTTITSTLNRVFTGASGSNNGTGANANKFLFNGANTIATASFVQVANEQQSASSGVGASLRGNVYLDGRANNLTNSVGYSQLYINSGGDVISDSKNSLATSISIYHRSTDATNGNKTAVNINAVMKNPTISAVSRSTPGVHNITSQNADNYTSIVQSGVGGQKPIHYHAYSQRDDALGFQHYKDATVSSGILNGNRNALLAGSNTFSNGFGFQNENTFLTNNTGMIVGLTEEYIVQNVGTGTTTAGKRYRHVNVVNGVASAYIMGLYATGVVIGNTTALPKASASLDLVDTTKGFLPNRLTTAQRDAVSWVAGDAGMIIYNSTTNKHQGWDGSTWNDMY